MLKPDTVARGLMGEVISRLEKKGVRIAAMKLIVATPEQAKRHYAIHEGKPFYPRLIEYIQSGPTVAMVLVGPNIIEEVRSVLGATDPKNAAAGTLRGDLAMDMTNNIAHASDSTETAEYEIPIYFLESEILDCERAGEGWIQGK